MTKLSVRNFAAALLFTAAAAVCAQEPMLVSVVDFLRPSPNEPIVDATLEALRQKFGEDKILVQTLTMDELSEAIAKRNTDIFISSAGFYRRVTRLGANALASLASTSYPNPNRREGVAFVVRAESAYETIDDLKGAVAAASTPTGFTGALIGLGELYLRGHDPEKFFKEIKYTGPGHYSAETLTLVRKHEADVAFVRTCLLEEVIAAHPQLQKAFRVIERKPISDDEASPVPCARSTDLYPGWIIASTPNTKPEVSKAVIETVFSMPPTASGHYWTVGTDMSSVDRLYRDLRAGPYAYLREMTVQRLWADHPAMIVFVVMLIFGGILNQLQVSRLVRIRTQELSSALEREKSLQKKAEEAAERINNMQRAGIIGQISSMIAHELRQPMGALSLYAKGAKRLIAREEIDRETLKRTLEHIEEQTDRASAIIDNVRAYAQDKKRSRSAVNLADVVRGALHSWKTSGRYSGVEVKIVHADRVLTVVNPLEWELVLLNLIKNGAEASKRTPHPCVEISLVRPVGDTAVLTVSDNGPSVSDETLARLEAPLETQKQSGLGLGLTIVRGIVEAHGARMRFTRTRRSSLKVEIHIPIVTNGIGDNGADEDTARQSVSTSETNEG